MLNLWFATLKNVGFVCLTYLIEKELLTFEDPFSDYSVVISSEN